MSRTTRRGLLVGMARSAGVVALGALACHSDRPRTGFLGAMERVNERFQRALFDPNRLAPELGEDALTPAGAFPQYKIGDDFPEIPQGWALVVGGLVKRPMTLSLDALVRLPRARVRV